MDSYHPPSYHMPRLLCGAVPTLARMEPGPVAEEDVPAEVALARIEAHYFAHDLFLPPEGLLGRIDRIANIPAEIVQGRYDMVCPPETAFELAAAWPGARLTIVPDAGHSALEPGVRTALVSAVERFRRRS